MKKKLLTKLMALTIVGATLGASGFATNTAFAAEYYGKFEPTAVKMISQTFDAKYYAATYPDVAKALGNDEDALLRHYLTFGIYEGRDASATFNADAYANLNADVAKAFSDGDDENISTEEYINYFLHYVTCGQKENRKASSADVSSSTTTAANKNYSSTSSKGNASNSGSTSSSGNASNTGSTSSTTGPATSDPNCLGQIGVDIKAGYWMEPYEKARKEAVIAAAGDNWDPANEEFLF